MGKGGGEQTSTTTQKADPWAGVQPYLAQLYQQAGANFNGPGAQYYPGSTVSQFTPEQVQAQGLTSDRALAGSADINPAIKQLQDTSSGAFLNSNPYLDATFDRAAGKVSDQFSKTVMPGIASMYSTAGRYGSGAMTTATGDAAKNLGDTLGGVANDIYGGNYQAERARQMQAAGLLPGVASQQQQIQYGDINALAGVGQEKQSMNQQTLNSDIARWDYNQNLPTQKLQQYAQLLQGGLGLTGSTSQTTAPEKKSSPAAGMAGGAMAGSAFGPWGAAAGAVLGGLFS